MRTIHTAILIAILFFSSPLFAQKLTIEEAVTGGATTFAIQTIDQLQWLPKSDNYVFQKEKSMLMVNVKGKEKTLFTLDQLNAWAALELADMPQINWTGTAAFYFEHELNFYHMDMKAQKVAAKIQIPKEAMNQDYHAVSRNLAFTTDNNLAVSLSGTIKALTANPKNIVSGQSISRQEYGIVKGTFWNPDGSKLAFYQKDEINVTDYPLTDYKTTPATIKSVKYPMAGSKSELISVGVYDVASGKTIFLDIDKGKPNDQFYATNLGWNPEGTMVYIAVLNRATTEMRMRTFDAVTGKELKTLFTETSSTYVEPEASVAFVPLHNDRFVWLSERDGYNNLYHYSIDGKLLGNTSAKFEITELIGFDSAGENAFVMATGEIPTDLLCYKISLADMTMTKVTPAHGTHTVQVSGSGLYVLDTYSNLQVPQRIELSGTGGRMIRLLLESPNPYSGKTLGITEIFSIKAKDGSELYCRMIKPHNFDPKRKYPVVVYVYNGPKVQLVQNNFLGGASLWMHCLAEDGYIVFTLDGHGSANRGKKFEDVVYRNMGTREMEDQLIGAEWLKQQPYIDANRMAVHGWSYGGFMTTTLMLRHPGTFKVGVAGGPVIDWRMYEVMYTERYMDTPEENPDGYKAADLTNYVADLKGDLLMIHGTDDETVVMQHNMKFLDACVKNRVQVDFFAYPGHAHNVRGKDRVHLITKVIDYIKENLGPPVHDRLIKP